MAEMPEQEMPAEAAPAEAAEAMPQEAPMAVYTAMTQVHEALGQSSSVPPEAMQALQASIEAYTLFLKSIGAEAPEAAEAPMPAGGPVSSQTQGSRAVPEGTPMRKGAVPA